MKYMSVTIVEILETKLADYSKFPEYKPYERETYDFTKKKKTQNKI